MSKQPPPAPTASTIGPCPTIIQIVGRPGIGSLPRTIAPPDLPPVPFEYTSGIMSINWFKSKEQKFCLRFCLPPQFFTKFTIYNQTLIARTPLGL